VGKITIAGGNSIIAEEGVYVDSWLAALTRVAMVQGDGVVDIPEEGVPLQVSAANGEIVITFRGNRAMGSTQSFGSALASSVRQFLQTMQRIPDDGSENPLRPILADFVRLSSDANP
jgi:hypothetical protein